MIQRNPRETSLASIAKDDVAIRGGPATPPVAERRRLGPIFRALQGLFHVVTRVAPGIKPILQNSLIRAGYEFVNTFSDDAHAFMNFGYAPLEPNANQITLLPEDEPDKYSLQLYHRVVIAADVHGKDVLEIGSGRGGGASFIMRYLGPRSLTGIDLTAKAVTFCRRRHRMEGLSFIRGNAEHLPFSENQFDVVINVESSHSYPSFPRFLDEVARILRPNGYFLFADMRPRDQVALLRGQMQNSALTILEEERITKNVLRALELDAPRRLRIVERSPHIVRSAVRDFTALEGTAPFEALRSGDLEYFRFAMQKRAN